MRRAAGLAALLLAQPRLAGGWAIGSGAAVDVFDPADTTHLFRWSAGQNMSYTDGLKGGITWAVEPTFCDNVLSRFPEETRMHEDFFGLGDMAMPYLLDCEQLLVTIRMAMASWAAANSNVRFFEVTTLCAGKWQSDGAYVYNASNVSVPGE
eukprot:6882309-Prymnesium_polylepis.1